MNVNQNKGIALHKIIKQVMKKHAWTYNHAIYTQATILINKKQRAAIHEIILTNDNKLMQTNHNTIVTIQHWNTYNYELNMW